MKMRRAIFKKKRFKERYRVEDGRICIDIQIKSLKQIFDEKDPAPFRMKDLDYDAIEYITSAVNEFPFSTPMKIVVYVEQSEEDAQISPHSLINAVHSFYSYEEDLAKKKLQKKLSQGQLAFFIGTLFLLFCLVLTEIVNTIQFHEFLKKFLLEGLGIIGWVALWHPVNIFLYEWWPIAAQRKIYEKISTVPVEVYFSR